MNAKPKRKSLIGLFFKSLIFGQRELISALEEEQLQSPFHTMSKKFFSRRLTQIGLIIFFILLLMCLIIPIFLPLDIGFVDSSMPHRPPGINMMSYHRALRGGNAAHVSAGSGFGVGVTHAGRIYTWGAFPTDGLDTPPGNTGRVVQVSAGLDHALALGEYGHVFTWGNRNFNLPEIPPHIQGRTTRVEAGFQYSAAILDDGDIVVWGNTNHIRSNIMVGLQQNPAVQIVTNTTTVIYLSECGQVRHLSPRSPAFGNIPDEIQGRTVSIAFTDRVGGALLDDGTVVTWGSPGEYAILVPSNIQGRVSEIHAGLGHFVVLLDDGTLAAWGNNYHGQATVPNISNIVTVYAGFHHNYAIDANGRIHTWGLDGFLFGTVHLGRDIFVRTMSAGRISMTVGAVAVLIATFIGITLGGFAGFFGGKVDMIIMRFSECVSALPFLPMAIILSHLLGNDVTPIGRLFVIMVVLGILTWPGLMRLVRGQIFQAKENEYVVAARALGVREVRIIFKHIFPNIISVITVWMSLNLAGSMLTESTLSFIGFGVNDLTPTWGNMLNAARSSTVLRDFWWRWIPPATALTLAAISINLIGDGLREATDPRAQER